MKILILGSQGFIGSHLVSYFVNEGNAVTGCDLVESSPKEYNYHKVSIYSADFDEIISVNNFELCINASGSGNVGYSLEHPLSDFEANAYSVVRVLDALRKYSPHCKYIHISSAAVYGNPQKLPITETDSSLPLSPYGYHKWISEMICNEYLQLFKIPIAILRPFSVYGSGLRKQLFWDICNRLRRDKKIELFGTGRESRDFIHIKDMCAIVGLIVKNSPFCGDVYNVANGIETLIQDVSSLFVEYFGESTAIAFSGNEKNGDPLNWRADISKIKSLGFTPSISFEEGVMQYIAWFKEIHKLN